MRVEAPGTRSFAENNQVVVFSCPIGLKPKKMDMERSLYYCLSPLLRSSDQTKSLYLFLGGLERFDTQKFERNCRQIKLHCLPLDVGLFWNHFLSSSAEYFAFAGEELAKEPISRNLAISLMRFNPSILEDLSKDIQLTGEELKSGFDLVYQERPGKFLVFDEGLDKVTGSFLKKLKSWNQNDLVDGLMKLQHSDGRSWGGGGICIRSEPKLVLNHFVVKFDRPLTEVHQLSLAVEKLFDCLETLEIGFENLKCWVTGDGVILGGLVGEIRRRSPGHECRFVFPDMLLGRHLIGSSFYFLRAAGPRILLVIEDSFTLRIVVAEAGRLS